MIQMSGNLPSHRDGLFLNKKKNLSREGHETLIQELVEQTEKPETIVVSVGGGGLAKGLIDGLVKAGWGDVNLVTLETEGANCFHEAATTGEIVTLPAITR